MKKMKKLLAVLLTFAMVLGMSLTAFAENDEVNKPVAGDKATATVSNVEAGEGVVVTAYQIIEGAYDDFGFLGFKELDGVAFEEVDLIDGTYMVDGEQPTSDEVTSIAKEIINGKTTLPSKTMKGKGTTYTADLEAGYWIVLVSGTVDKVYNPMLVGVYYDKDKTSGSNATLTPGAVDAEDNWELTTINAYAKSTTPDLNKSIVDKDGKDNTDGNDNGQSVAYGDTVYFKLDEMTVPSYSKEYTQVTVKITDTLSEGLTLNQDSIVIKVGGTVLPTKDYTINKSAQGFEIQLKSEYVLKVDAETNLLENAGKDIVVTYNATVDNDAPFNYDENSNTAKFIYSNDPTNTKKPIEIEDKTYVYTFAIDADLDGEGSKVTEELFKVAVDENGTVVYDCQTTSYQVKNPLAGATFRLTNTATNKEYEATSDTNGMLTFKGLDAGTYTLREIAAPTGFSINDETHTVEITAEYNTDGTLKSYSITIDEEATSTYSATYKEDKKEISTKVVPTEIKNTKLVNLPSTGGIGTTIFTIGGCAIMIVAAYFFMVNRRKEEQ